MDLKLKIELDCSDRIVTAITTAAQALSSLRTADTKEPAPRRKPAEKKPKEAPTPTVEEPVKPTETKEPVAETAPEQEVTEAAPKKESLFEAPAIIKDEDLRAAMEACRARNMAAAPEDENDPTKAAVRKSVNLHLRSKVESYGCTNSTSLTQEQRADFIEYTKTLDVNAPF